MWQITKHLAKVQRPCTLHVETDQEQIHFCDTQYTLVTRDQPYLFATIFKHFIYVRFQLLIFMNENQLKLH